LYFDIFDNLLCAERVDAMLIIFCLLFLIAIIVFIVGLIRPCLIMRWGPEEKKTRKRMAIIGSITIIFFFACVIVSVPPMTDEQKVALQQKQQQEKEQKALADAQKKAQENQATAQKAEQEKQVSAQKVYDDQAVYDKWVPKEIERLSKKTLGSNFISVTVNDNLGDLNSDGKIVLIHFDTAGRKIFNINAEDIFKDLYSRGLPIDEITLFGEAELVDVYGKTSKRIVAKCTMPKSTASKIS